MSGFGVYQAMDIERSDFSEDRKGDSLFGGSCVSCSICLEFVVDPGKRSTAKLQCGHEFHLDCIGSAFNAKGAMQCPNCRNVEKGQWLYANGYRSFTDFDVDELVEDLYELSYSELPFGLQWCPFGGFPQLSPYEEGEPHPNSYHELFGSSAFVDHSNASSSTHVCPYLALHGFPLALHPTLSNAGDAVPDASSFHQHPTGLGGPSPADLLNPHRFSATEPQHHSWLQPSVLSMSGGGVINNANQSASQLSSRLSRNDSSGQQRLGSFGNPLPFLHGSVTRAGSNLVTSIVPPITGDSRSQTRGGQIYPQSAAASSLWTSPFAPVRRARPRGLALVSSVGINSSTGFTMSGTVDRNHQDGEGVGRRFNRFYGWVREEFAPHPWNPAEGESQWWSPFHHNQNPQMESVESMSRSYFQHRVISERAGGQGRPENAYQGVPLPRMPPFM